MRPKRPTKAELRQQLKHDTQHYLDDGGEVKPVARGESGLINGYLDERRRPLEKTQQTRTPVDDVLKTIDERKQQKRKTHQAAANTTKRRPKKRIIYDDFGEPIREVWEE